jgi:hypothetical protein
MIAVATVDVGTDVWNSNNDIGWASTTTPFRDGDCSNSQHPLHACQRPTSAFIGLGLTTPEPVLSPPGGHHFVRNKQQP